MATPTRPDAASSPAPSPEPAPPPEASQLRLGGIVAAGLRSAWACRMPLAIVLAVNLALAVGVVYPLLGPMDASLSFHPEAERIGGHLDSRWWGDWTREAAALVDQSRRLLSGAGLVMVLSGAFFAGGLLTALREGPLPPLRFEPLPDPHYAGATPQWRSAAPGPASPAVFVANCARHFPRLFVFLLLSLPFYALVHLLLNRLATTGLQRILEGVDDERLALALLFARAAIFVIAFYAVTVLFEYVRIHEVLKPGAPLGSVLSLSFRALKARPGLFLGIETSAFILQAAAVAAFLPLDRLLGGRPGLAATGGLLATQIFIFLRLLIRTGIQGAQLRLAQSVLGR